MNMRQMKNSMKLLVMAMMAVAMGMVGCSSKPADNSGTVDGDGYPMPNMQQACMNRLNHILMSDEGRAMTGKQLAELTDPEKLRNMFQIALPVCDDDQLPCMGTYLNEETGGTIVFSPITVEDPLDTIHAVCNAAYRIVYFDYEDSTCLLEAYDTVLVHNRGNGIMSFYRYVHRGGPNGGKHRCYDKHPDGYPEYGSLLLSVYPGGDSLVYTCGYEKSKRVYRFVGK